MAETLGSKIRRNTRASLIAFGWGQVINVIRMLVLFQFLAPSGYALWVFAFSLTSYFVIYNFGIANAFVKYTAEYNAREDYEGLNHLLSTGMVIALVLAAGVAAVLLLFTDQAVEFFNISAGNQDEARFVLIGVGLVSAFSIAFNVYPAVLTGIQRLDIVNYSRVIMLTVEVALTFGFLYAGYGLRAVLLIYAGGIVCSTAIMAVFAYRQIPQLRLGPWHARRACVGDMLNLGGKMQALGIVAMIVSTLDIVVFMKLSTEAMVGLYAISQRVAQRAQGIARQGFGALAPASAELFTQEDRAKLSHVYDTANRFTLLISVWVFAYLAMCPEWVMMFIMDEKYDELSVWLLRWIAIANLIHAMTGPGSSMLRGAGKPMREIVYQCLTMLAFFVALYPFLGETFEPKLFITWPVALVVASLVFIGAANIFFKVSVFSPLDKMLVPIVAAFAIASGINAAWYAVGLPAPENRWLAMPILAVTGGAYSVLYGTAVWFLPGLTESDRYQLQRFAPGPLGRLLARARRIG